MDPRFAMLSDVAEYNKLSSTLERASLQWGACRAENLGFLSKGSTCGACEHGLVQTAGGSTLPQACNRLSTTLQGLVSSMSFSPLNPEGM